MSAPLLDHDANVGAVRDELGRGLGIPRFDYSGIRQARPPDAPPAAAGPSFNWGGWGEMLAGSGGVPSFGEYAGGALDFFGRATDQATSIAGYFDTAKQLREDRKKKQAEEERQRSLIDRATGQRYGSADVSDGSADGPHAQYRSIVAKYAAQHGIDVDAVMALLPIETPNGDPRAVSPAGARGLMQVMPFHAPDNPDSLFDPETNIRIGVAYYAGLYKQFGDYALAAAAYQGGPGAIVNGQPRSDVNDGNMTPAQYADAWRRHYARQKATAKRAPQSAAVNAQGAAQPVKGWKGTVQLHHGSHPGGADLFAETGTPVNAIRGGTVIGAGYSDVGGNWVSIQGDDGLQYYYAHLYQLPAVRTGQKVSAGTSLGGVGDTGNAKGTGAHLHLGIGRRIATGVGPQGGAGLNDDGTPFNAIDYIRALYGN